MPNAFVNRRKSAVIENEVKIVMTLWKKKKNLKKQITGTAAYIRREKNIYYDTDDITEKQIETVRRMQRLRGCGHD